MNNGNKKSTKSHSKPLTPSKQSTNTHPLSKIIKTLSIQKTTTPSGSKVPSGSKAPIGSKAPSGSATPSGSKAPSGSTTPSGSKVPIGSKAPSGSKKPITPTAKMPLNKRPRIIQQPIKKIAMGCYGVVTKPPLKLIIPTEDEDLNITKSGVGKVFIFEENNKHIIEYNKELDILKIIRSIDPKSTFTVSLKGAFSGTLDINSLEDKFRDSLIKDLKIAAYQSVNDNIPITEIIFYQIILEDAGVPVNEVKEEITYICFLKAIKALVEGIIILGENGRIHHDIKPSNVLFKNNKLSLIDFGLCITTDKAYKLSDVLSLHNACYIYYPPEYYILYLILTILKIEDPNTYIGTEKRDCVTANNKRIFNKSSVILLVILKEVAKDLANHTEESMTIKIYNTRLLVFMSEHSTIDETVFYKHLCIFVKTMIQIIEKSVPQPNIEDFLYNNDNAFFGVNSAKKLDIYGIGYIILELKRKIKGERNDSFINGILKHCFVKNPRMRISGTELKTKIETEIENVQAGRFNSYKGGNKCRDIINFNKNIKNG